MENMSEGPNKKILTEEERLKLQRLSSFGPTIEKWHMGDEGANYPIFPVDLKNTIHYFSLSKSLVMSKSVYDSQKIEKDAFDMDNMREGKKHFILTAEECIQIGEIEAIKEGIEDAKKTAKCGISTADEAKEAAESALRKAKGAETKAVDAQAVAATAQKTAESAQASINGVQETADKAQKTAEKVQEKVDLIQSLEQQDWINGTKTENALISPVHLQASIQANSRNSTGNGSCSCNGALKPIEILMTESEDIPWPEGATDDTELEIWAWGGGNAGDDKDGSGGIGGCCTYLRTKKKFLGNSSVRIGKGGKATGDKYGASTTVGRFIKALNGRDRLIKGGIDGVNGPIGNTPDGGDGGDGALGGKGGDGGKGSDEVGYDYRNGASGIDGKGGDNFLSDGGRGGNGGKGGSEGSDGSSGHGSKGGDSIYGCGIGGDGGGGGHGGNGGNSVYGGGGGGYFPGKDATSSSSGDGGDGAVLIKVYL